MNGDLNSWDKFCNYLWFDKKLNIWLDISKINFTSKEIKNLEDKFKDVFSSIKELENGAISNIDENRQVGHYWLRNPSISPSSKIGEEIRGEEDDTKNKQSQCLMRKGKTSPRGTDGRTDGRTRTRRRKPTLPPARAKGEQTPWGHHRPHFDESQDDVGPQPHVRASSRL